LTTNSSKIDTSEAIRHVIHVIKEGERTTEIGGIVKATINSIVCKL
jgi:hypothetical protein